MKVARRLLRALRKRTQQAAATGTVAAILASLGAQQRAFVSDQSDRKAALCGRRAGKSHGVAAWLLIRALQRPDGLSLFIAITRSGARQIIHSALRKVAALAGVKFREQTEDGQLYYVLENGHRIWVAGCHNIGEIDKFRGFAYWSVAVDECGFMAGYLEELVEGALDPALMDYEGHMALTSSPGVVPVGYFHDVTTGGKKQRTDEDDEEEADEWALHHWTVASNPAIPHWERYLNRKKKRNNWTDESPVFVREYLGRWVNDSGGLVYPFAKALNNWDGVLPAGGTTTVIGVDVGFRDAMGFVVASTVEGTGKKYIRLAQKQEGMTPNAVVARVRQLLVDYPGARVVVDEGGMGKGYAVHMREEGIGCESAEKLEKRAHQEWLAGEILPGNVLVDYERCRPLVDECLVLRWGEDGKEDPRFPNHAADAALYACRALRVTYDQQGAGAPPPGTAAFAALQQLRHKTAREKEMRALMRRKRGAFGS